MEKTAPLLSEMNPMELNGYRFVDNFSLETIVELSITLNTLFGREK